MPARQRPSRLPWALALAALASGMALVAAGLWVLRAFVLPASNGEGLVPGLVGSVVLQVTAGLVAAAGFLLVVWIVIQLAGRLPPESATDADIDARLAAALVKHESLGPSEPLPAPSGLPWERA